MARWAVDFQHITQVKNLHAPEALISHLQSKGLGVRCQAHLNRIPSARELDGVQPSIEAVGDDGHPPPSMLGDQGDVSTIPAQRWRAMGLMTFELWQCLNGSINHIAQLHRLAPSKVADHSEPFPVATQGRILLACGQ